MVGTSLIFLCIFIRNN